ncbi:MAG TPA: glycosyltransferase family 1 protein [Candidatus Baltobacteraceae bacterium]
MKPEICIDARATRQMSVGMIAYARELRARLPRVAPEYSYRFFDRGGNFGWNEQVAMPLAMRRARPGLSHFLSQYVPLLPPPPFVLTIHDLIHLRFPQFFKGKVGPYYRTVVRSACARAARVITDDPRTVEDLRRLLHVDIEKIRVVPLGVSEAFSAPAAAYRAERPYLLYVGNHRTHKNLATLFDAWSGLPERHAVDLYVTGPDDFGGELERRSDATRRIRALGDVEDDALIGYYRGARALVHPALCEGFGLPMLEAMAAGAPVIASDEAVPAVLRDAAAVFPARDAGALRMALESVLDDEGFRGRLVNQGAEMAKIYTWDRCARATADVYAEILA